MRGYKQKIKQLLEDNPEYREDDRKLTLAVWRDYGFYLTPEQEELFMKIPQAQIISRRRREFMALYPPSEAVDQKRFAYFKEFKEEMIPVPKAISWWRED